MASPSAVRVGGQKDVRGVGSGFLEFLDQVTLVLHGQILGREILLGVDSEGGPGKVADMPH